MSERFRSRAAVRDKVGWEGGIIEALEYGIKAAEMPEGDEELTAAWQAMQDAFEALQPLAATVDELLEAADDDEDGDNRWPCCQHCTDGDGMLPCGQVHDEPCGTGDCGNVTDAEIAEWRKGLSDE